MRHGFAIGLFSMAFALIVSCGDGNADVVQNKNTAIGPIVYEASELARLMKQMQADNRMMRDHILAGDLPGDFPAYFKNIHSAQATDEHEINETYHAMADFYLQQAEGVATADSSSVISAFNNLVSSCISCHKVYCQGPIPSIQKLYIPDPHGT